MNRVRFPLMTLEYLSIVAMLALGGVIAGGWLADQLTSRINQVCELMAR